MKIPGEVVVQKRGRGVDTSIPERRGENPSPDSESAAPKTPETLIGFPDNPRRIRQTPPNLPSPGELSADTPSPTRGVRRIRLAESFR